MLTNCYASQVSQLLVAAEKLVMNCVLVGDEDGAELVIIHSLTLDGVLEGSSSVWGTTEENKRGRPFNNGKSSTPMRLQFCGEESF